MSEYLWKCFLGLVFTIFAMVLIHLHTIFAALPAAAGVYLLGSALWDAVRRNY